MQSFKCESTSQHTVGKKNTWLIASIYNYFVPHLLYREHALQALQGACSYLLFLFPMTRISHQSPLKTQSFWIWVHIYSFIASPKLSAWVITNHWANHRAQDFERGGMGACSACDFLCFQNVRICMVISQTPMADQCHCNPRKTSCHLPDHPRTTHPAGMRIPEYSTLLLVTPLKGTTTQTKETHSSHPGPIPLVLYNRNK